MPDANTSTQGLSQPATDGVEYGQITLDNSDPVSAFGTGERTTSITIVADPGNGDNIYIGWDSDVDETSGIPLEAGSSFSADLDVAQQEVYIMTDAPTQVAAIASVG